MNAIIRLLTESIIGIREWLRRKRIKKKIGNRKKARDTIRESQRIYEEFMRRDRRDS